MKQFLHRWLLLLPLLLATWTAGAQTLLQQESFETNGEGSRYATNYTILPNTVPAAAPTRNQYWFRASEADLCTSPCTGNQASHTGTHPVGGTLNGTFYWAGEGVRGGTPVTPGVFDRAPGTVTLNSVTTTGYRNLQVVVGLQDGRYSPTSSNWESDDTLKVQVRFNGAGPWVTVGQFTSDATVLVQTNPDVYTGQLRQDVNLDGRATTADPLVTATMQDFTFNLPGTATTLQTRFVASQAGLSEEFSFDNIRVLGTATANAAPVLANIEPTIRNYPTANTAVQITNTITLTDADNPTQTSAIVRITTGWNPANDVLAFAGTGATGNIAGSFSTSTGVLALTSAGSTATLAQWQAALRLVTFQTNTALTSGSQGRAILFATTDPSANQSNAVFRTVGFSPAVAATVSTTAVGTVTPTSAVLGGNVTNDGGDAVTDRGVVYVVGTGTPTTSNTKVQIGTGTGSFSQTITGLAASTQYTVRAYAINSAGTAYGSNVTFTTPAALTATPVSQTNVSCFGGSNGSATVSASGGVAPYTYSWSPSGGTAATASGLAAGTYTVTVTDASSAMATRSFTITQPTAALAATKASQTNIACFGGSNGAASINLPTGGSPGYIYDWTPGNPTGDGTRSVTGLTAGNWTVTVSDINNCQTSQTFTISQPTAALSSSGSQTNVSCFGGSNGSATVTPSGGTPGYTYLWSTGATTQTVTSLSAATYNVTVTDANGCTTTRSFTISQPASVVSGSRVVTNVSCNGGSNGAINLTPSGGVAPYTFLWNSGATTEDRTSLTAGTYSVTITDANGCQGTVANITITQPGALTTTGSQTNVSTNGGSDGTATVTPSGGTPGYTYLWSNGATTQSVTGLSAATYNVTVTDANGCTTTRNFTITQPSTATVTSVTRLMPSPAATAQVRYQVVFSASVTGVTVSNFDVTNTGSVSGTNVSSVVGSGTTYTVTVNTGTGDGTLRLNVNNSTGVSPTVSGLPYTSGEVYTITKSFAAAPQLTIVGTGGTGSDVTAFVDVVQVLSGGAPFANALQNSSFETHDALGNGDFGYNPTGASWTFNTRSGIAEQGSAFTPITPIPSGIAVAFVQSQGGTNGQLQQNLALPTGSSYQVRFQTAQRVCCTSLDQVLNVFLNGVFVGTVQPGTSAYTTFTSATFAVTAPALTATISSPAGASGSSTMTSPIPYTVTFSQAVTGFSAAGVSVTNGTISGFSGSGTTYTFNVTPTASGAVTVSVPANSAVDTNNTGNTATSTYTLNYSQPVTAAPVVTNPAHVTLINTNTPTYAGTAVPGSTVTLYVDGSSIGTTTANGMGNFSLVQPTALAEGTHTVYATAQSSGSSVSANSNVNGFTVDTVRPTVAITSSTGANGGNTSTTPIAYTVTFSENVTGFVAGDVTVGNGAIGGFTAVSGTTYTFNVTPAANGAVTVNVPANVAQDAASNFNTAATQYSITYTALITATSWTGTVSTDWFDAGNWTNGVPKATVDATIVASAPFMPLVATSTATAKNLTLNSGATLTQTGGTLDLQGNLTNNGTFTAPGGTVVLGSATLASVLGSNNTRFWNLSIGANGARSSTSASTSVQRLFTLNGSFTTNGNPFILESNAATTAMVVNNGSNAIVGTATVQRYIMPDLNPNLGYRHVSAPISNATVGSLATPGFTPVVNPAYNTSATPTAEVPFPTVYGYDQARLATTTNNLADFDKGWFSPASLSSALTVGQGYTVNLAASQTWNFVGTPNNGNVTQTLARNSGATAAASGLQLLGNPYPSPLDWSLVTAADRPNLDGIIYVFASNDPTNPYTGSYSFYQAGFGTISPVLPLGQGFFVRVTPGQTSGSLSLKNSHRPTSYTNPTYHRTAETRPVVHMTLRGAGSTLTDDAFVYFEVGATNGFDAQYDGMKLANPSGLNLSSSLSATERLCVNGLAPLTTTQRIVPLAVGVPAVGSYTLNAAEVLNLSTTPVYLRDLQTGAVVDLARQPSYSFVVSNATALSTGRFELVFAPQSVLATAPAALAAQVGLYPNPASKVAFVELPAALGRVAVTAKLVDALGRSVQQLSLPAQGAAAHRLELGNLATGVYTLHLATAAGVVVKKLIVE